MKDKLLQIKEQAIAQIAAARDDLDEIKVRYLGKKGELTTILKQMGGLSAEERPQIGQLANQVRADIADAIAKKAEQMKAEALKNQLEAERVDVTIPGRLPQQGGLHPMTQVLDDLTEIFLGMGFSVAEGPEVELDYYNFEALNLPPDHPARDTQDTFYITDNILLRTQTSPVQVRTMEKQKPPIKVIAPGRVYRSDAVDATHSPVFHQIEGLVVDKGITMADLKGTLEVFTKKLYGADSVVRFRPHHFPFTEPSAEMDTQCYACHGAGCRLCKGEGWIELLGCGMGAAKLRYRPRGIQRLRLWYRLGAGGHAALRYRRYAAVLRERPAVLEPVLTGGREDDPFV